MEYTDEELMLLEQLTYLNDDVYKAAGISNNANDYQVYKTIGGLLNAYGEDELDALEAMGNKEVLNDNGEGTHVSGAEWAAIIRALKKNDKLTQLNISHVTTVESGDKNGYNFDSMCFNEPGNEKDAIVCFRGTLNGKEWNDDAEYVCAADTDCNQSAMVYINGLPYSNITVVGHSKGANKAAYVYFGSNKVKYCVAMDMPGFPPEYYLDNSDIIASKKENIKCYALEADYVNILVLPIPGVETLYCQGNGVANFAENHCPNCFFFYKDGDPYCVVTNNQSESMKILHNFTAFVALEMPYDERIKVSSYLGNVLEMLLGGGSPSSQEIIDIVFSDQESLETIIAYFMKYCDTYNINAWDAISIVYEIKTSGDGSAESDDSEDVNIVGELLENNPDMKLEEALAIAFVLMLLKGYSSYKEKKTVVQELYKHLKDSHIGTGIKSKYDSLSSIQPLESLDYEGYNGKKYNYTKDTYTQIKDCLAGLNDVEYTRPSELWNCYSEEEWYDDICAESIKTALTEFIDMVPLQTENCGTEFDTAFNNEWSVDERYMNLMASQMRFIDECIHKFVLLKERMEYNVNVE